MNRIGLVAIVAILGTSMIGTAHLTGNNEHDDKDWFKKYWSNNIDWFKKNWDDLDFKKIWASMNTGGSNDDDDDDDDDEDDDDQNVIDHASIGLGVGIRPVDYDNQRIFQNVVNECVFHSGEPLEQLCIKCKFLDESGEVVATGEKIELKWPYKPSTQITIPMSDPDAKPLQFAANGIDDVENVKLELCGVKDKCPDIHKDMCKCDERKKDHKKHYDDFDKYYKDNKNKFGKGDYSKHMNDYEEYFDENGKYMDRSDYKMFMDYHEKFLKDNKKSFSDKDYRHYSDEQRKYNNDYPKHDEKCKCDGQKEDHKKHYDDYKKSYDDNKKKFGKEDYSKYMNDYEKYINDNGKYMDKSDYKMFMDYHEKFLNDNKKSFSSNDYKRYSDEHKKYSNDYPKHDDDDDDDDDDNDNECKKKSGFFVGGGKVYIPKNGGTYQLTHGFELHCDATQGPNNLEINWLQNKFHLEELEEAECIDDGTQNEPPPSPHPGPTLDIYNGEGFGRYNGVCGAYAIWEMDDNGEPGKNNDQILSLKIYDKKIGENFGNLVLEIKDGHPLYLQTGNHQFVPHPSTHPNPPTQTTPCPEMTP